MKIIIINLARMVNEIHVQYHEVVRTFLERINLLELGLKPLFDLYLSAFNNEQEALLLIRKSELTARVSEQDRARDAIYRGFSDTVKGLRNHFDPEVHEPANRLWSVFLHYGNITQKTFDAQTAATNDMLRELRQPEMQQIIDDLNLTGWVEKMDEENQKFHQLMMQRYNEPTMQTPYRMKTARLETDKYYRAITVHIDNLALTANDDENLNHIITELNAIVKRFKNILAQQFGKKATKS